VSDRAKILEMLLDKKAIFILFKCASKIHDFIIIAAECEQFAPQGNQFVLKVFYFFLYDILFHLKQSFFIIAQNFRIQTDKLRNIIIEEPFFCLPLMCFLLLYSIYQPVGESIIIYDYDIMTIDKEVNAVSASEDICQFG